MASRRPVRIIGELMNTSFARARRAWETRDPRAFAGLAKVQTDLGADFMTLYLGGTQTLKVSLEEMLAFLPAVVPAIQKATAVPISFDHPSVAYHREAMCWYDRVRAGAPILNSISASRERVDEYVDLAARYDTWVIVMASERVADGGGAPAETAAQVHEAARHFAELLRRRGKRRNDQIVIDPGLCPVGADVTGATNRGLDAMRLIRKDPDLQGVHLSVGLTNFSFGMPAPWRVALENAYLTLAVEAGLDFVLGNPEKDLRLLEPSDPALIAVRDALVQGRPVPGEDPEDAGLRQASRVMALCR